MCGDEIPWHVAWQFLAIKLFIIDIIIIPIWVPHWNRNQTLTVSCLKSCHRNICRERGQRKHCFQKYVFTVVLSYSGSEFALCIEEHAITILWSLGFLTAVTASVICRIYSEYNQNEFYRGTIERTLMWQARKIILIAMRFHTHCQKTSFPVDWRDPSV